MALEEFDITKDNIAKDTFLSLLANVSEQYNILLKKETITIDETTKILSQIMEAYSFYNAIKQSELTQELSDARIQLSQIATTFQNLEQFKGAKGDKGDTGLTGASGQNGIDGINGAKGDIGLQGIQGIKGDNGLNGTNGVDGSITFEALTPEQKATLKGDTGLQGIQGIKGDTGIQGIQGIKGDTGLQGIQGISLNPVILQVVHFTNNLTTATTVNNYSHFNETIIPISANSRFLITCNMKASHSQDSSLYFKIGINDNFDLASSGRGYPSATSSIYVESYGNSNSATAQIDQYLGEYMYTHTSTNSFNLKINHQLQVGTMYLNRSSSYDDIARGRPQSTLTIIEIGA